MKTKKKSRRYIVIHLLAIQTINSTVPACKLRYSVLERIRGEGFNRFLVDSNNARM